MPIEKGDVVSAIEEMNAALRLKFEAIRDLFSATAATDARARRELGASILDIKRAPGTYGTGSVALLARALGRDMATLYRYAQVASCWSTADLEKILASKGPSAQSLSWSHLVELATVEPAEVRKALLRETVDRGLSVREIVQRVRDMREDSEVTTAETTTLSADLRELVGLFERLQQSALEWDEASLARLATPKREECTSETLRLLERALKAQSLTADACRRNVERLTAAKAHVSGVLANPKTRSPTTAGRRPPIRAFLLSGGGGKGR